MIPGKKFNPATGTSRRPTPEKFEHLRKWIDVDTKFIDITNITNLKNINIQLEQTSVLYASNVISRVIAQLIGATPEGFVTLEATDDGKLKVDVRAGLPTTLRKDITGAGGAHDEIIGIVTGKTIKIVNIMFTVDDEVNITFESHETAISGAMDFGGADEPRGMVHHFGDHPLEMIVGEAFKISTVGAGLLNGYVTYFTE